MYKTKKGKYLWPTWPFRESCSLICSTLLWWSCWWPPNLHHVIMTSPSLRLLSGLRPSPHDVLQACLSRNLILGELRLLSHLSLLIPSSHLPKDDTQKLFWNPHLLSGHTQSLSASGPLLRHHYPVQAFLQLPWKSLNATLFFLAGLLSFCLSLPCTPTHGPQTELP